MSSTWTFYEFFAGGGMARLGLGKGWQCLFANDFDAKKSSTYRQNFPPAREFVEGDVRALTTADLPGQATLAWASFPCQDLSLAGPGFGLAGERSGVFWPFWDLMKGLQAERRNPPIIVLENVTGLITSHNGEDLRNLITGIVAAGYKVGAMVVDAALFLPQSRPRLILVAVAKHVKIPKALVWKGPHPVWHPKALQDAVSRFPLRASKGWIWWHLPVPTEEPRHLQELIDDEPQGVDWHTPAETKKILQMMTSLNLEKVEHAKRSGERMVGTIYRRTRPDEDGTKVQRAEVRFDGISGCLRTPAGGSSRQTIILVNSNSVRTRLISPRETARLMGLPESYELPPRYNDAYHLTGDGVVVPVVGWLKQHLITPLASATARSPSTAKREQALDHV